MKKLFTHHFGFFLVALTISSTAFFLFILKPEAALGDSYSFINPGKSIAWTSKKYHSFVNTTFNEFFEKLVQYMETGSRDSAPVTSPAEGEECGAENISTYCLAEKVTKSFIAYEADLLARKSQLGPLTDCGTDETPSQLNKWLSWGETKSTPTLEQATKVISGQQSYIDSEIDAARDALDMSLQIYSEFQVAYPMHQEYAKIIKSLEAYRSKLYDVRRNIMKYPTRFTNVSTPNCT